MCGQREGVTEVAGAPIRVGVRACRLVRAQGFASCFEPRALPKAKPSKEKALTTSECTVQAAVIKILMSLLKEPDFREHLLELGLKAAKARLDKDKKKVLPPPLVP